MNTSDFDSTVAGIPCGIYIIDADELEFGVLDRKGYEAPWLYDKLTYSDKLRIGGEIIEYIEWRNS